MNMLDTDILIDLQRKLPAAVLWLSSLPDVPMVPGFVVLELIQGCRNSLDVADAVRLTSAFPIVWPNEIDCNRALVDYSKLHLSHRIGLVDVLIASCAVGIGFELCTFNEKHYRAVPGLILRIPYERP